MVEKAIVKEESGAEITRKVRRKEEHDFYSIFKRMDFDFDLWSLKNREPGTDYTIDSPAFLTNRENELKYTSPAPRSLADHIHSRLANSRRTIIVRMLEKEGEDKRDDVSALERLMAFGFDAADDRLTNILFLPPLLDYLIWSAMIRGRLSARILVRKDGDKVLFDYTPLDPRFLVYELGKDGLAWTAYKTYRSASSIKSEYDIKPKDSLISRLLWWQPKDQNNVVTDYWEIVEPGVYKNIVIVGESQVVLEETHELTTSPVLYLAVPSVPPVNPGEPRSGKITAELGQTSKNGDSIYAGVREVYQFENDLFSMWASHNKILADQPIINYFDEEGLSNLTTTTSKAGLVINVPMNHNKLEPSPVNDVSDTLMNLVGLVAGQRQRATLPDVEFGELRNLQLSGTAINELKEARDKVFGPLIRSLNIMYTNIVRSVEQQLIDGGISVTVKSELNRKYYEHKVTPVDLKKPHIVRVEFSAQTPWEQMDTAQLADMLKRQGFPDQWIWENVYKIQDPKELEDMSAVEIATHSPILMRLKAISILYKEGRRDEGDTVLAELRMEMEQMQTGEQSPQEQPS